MYDSSLPPVPPMPETQKQSRVGIASFAMGILGVVMFCIGFLIAVGTGVSIGLENPYATDPAAIMDQASTIILIASGFIYCSPVLSLIGLGLGIASAVQKNEKKTLGIIGLVLNALTVLAVCGLIFLGLVMQGGTLGV